MRDLPTAAKVIINTVLYVLYVLVASIAFSFIFPLVLQIFGKGLLSPNDPVFVKIQIFIAFLVLVITIIMRRHFYMSLKNTSDVMVSTTNKSSKDGLNIKIEKEIK